VSGVSYLHEKGKFHRDLKPESIFVTLDGTHKIGMCFFFFVTYHTNLHTV
jgi:serine/threonine protein kinase